MSEPSEEEMRAGGSPGPRPDPVQQLWLLWRQGQRVDVQQYLDRAGQLTPPQVAAVLLVDQRERWLTGERLPAESYLPLYPTLRADLEFAVELIYGEYLLREELGDRPMLAEYRERFPQYASRLKQQLELHQALDSVPLAGATPARSQTPVWERAGVRWPAVKGYEILGTLGRGGMGVVYRARQRDANRVVALKMILAGADAGSEALARFRTEIEAVARLQHPHIVQIYEVGEQDGRPYFSMEFADDGSLAQKLTGTPLAFRRSAELLEMLGRAIHYAHERGIIHRDLAPSNVLLMADGTPKITDFGLAKLVEHAAQSAEGDAPEGAPRSALRARTQSGAVLGTPSYMPPEQAAGKTREIGPAGDVYALGAILYEMLTGRPPFRAETPLETLRQVMSEEPVPPSRLQPHLPRDLVTICLKCLQKEPRKRYGSARELAEDLERFLDGKPIQARRTVLLERGWRWCRRKPAVATLTAAVALLLMSVAVGSTLSALWLRDQRNDATEKLWGSFRDQAKAGRLSQRAGQRFESLKALAEAAKIGRQMKMPEERFLQLRNEAIACLALPDLRPLTEWEANTPWYFPVAFDVGLEHMACSDDEGNICVTRVSDQQEMIRLAGPGTWPATVLLQFSRNGRFLAAGYFLEDRPIPNQCLVWELLGGPRIRKVPLAEEGRFLGFSADNCWIAVGRQDGSLGLYNLGRHQEQRLWPGLGVEHLVFSPDSRQVAYSTSSRRAVYLLDVETKEIVPLEHPSTITQLAWAGDGRLLAAGCEDQKVHVWDAVKRQEQSVLEGQPKQLTTLAFSPAGDLLAVGSNEGSTQLWDAVSGRHLVSALGQCVHFSPDGQRLAFRDGSRLGVWEVADGRECSVLHDGRMGNRTPWNSLGLESLDFSPSGRLLVTAGGGGVRLWDVASAREVACLDIGRHEAARFHPSGGQLFTYGQAGLRSWPIHALADGPPDALQVGPPRVLDVPRSPQWFRAGCSRDGRVLAVGSFNTREAIVVHVERPKERVILRDCPQILSIAVSPDGRWVAVGLDRKAIGIKVFDAASGSLVWQFSANRDESRAFVAFSPDGRWLVAGGQGAYRFWEVGSWEPGPVLPRDRLEVWIGPLAFTPDGRMLAICRSLQRVQLIDLTTLREVATLSAADAQPIQWLCFSPDGSRLAAATDNHTSQLWDLRAIRRQLAEIGLDWDLPAYPPLAQATETQPLQVTVDLGELGKLVPKEESR